LFFPLLRTNTDDNTNIETCFASIFFRSSLLFSFDFFLSSGRLPEDPGVEITKSKPSHFLMTIGSVSNRKISFTHKTDVSNHTEVEL
jgi:hypothetical protein